MPTLLDEHLVTEQSAAAQRLRTTMAAMRLSFCWWGTRKTLSTEQKAQAAESFGAAGEFLSAGKKLIDTGSPKFKAVTAVRHRAVQLWKGMSLPYAEPGIRLIKHCDLDLMHVQMTSLKAELEEAVRALNEQLDDLKQAARQRLGRLYNESDYPASLLGLFELGWDFPSVEPPDYLRRLHPQLYEQEAKRVAARFDEAVQLAEHAFMDELTDLVSHLTERLSGTDDGKPKVFRDSAITNLTDFFERFRHLNVRSSEQLDELVERAQRAVRGVQPQSLRDEVSLRHQIGKQLTAVQASLDGMLVDRPRRQILRRPK
jgi:hypothetical protein